MKRQAGNVLFIILIGIALLAALSYAVVKDNRTVSDSIGSKEQARLLATELIQFGDDVRLTVGKMLLSGSVTDLNTAGTGVLFAATGANASYGVVGTQPKTEVFYPSGGALTYQKPPSPVCSGCTYEFTGQILIGSVGTASKYELAMILPSIPKSVCESINSVQRHGFSSIPTDGALTLTRFTGTNYGDTGGSNTLTLAGGSGEITGKRSFCYKESAGGGRYIFVHVLHAR